MKPGASRAVLSSLLLGVVLAGCSAPPGAAPPPSDTPEGGWLADVEAYGNPIDDGDFVITAVRTEDSPDGPFAIAAVEPATGEVAWSVPLPAPATGEVAYAATGGVVLTVSDDGASLYATYTVDAPAVGLDSGGIRRYLAAFAADSGAVRFAVPVPGDVLGMPSADTVLVTGSEDGDAGFTALAAEDGAERYVYDGTATPVGISGSTVVGIVPDTMNSAVVGIDARSGDTEWSTPVIEATSTANLPYYAVLGVADDLVLASRQVDGDAEAVLFDAASGDELATTTLPTDGIPADVAFDSDERGAYLLYPGTALVGFSPSTTWSLDLPASTSGQRIMEVRDGALGLASAGIVTVDVRTGRPFGPVLPAPPVTDDVVGADTVVLDGWSVTSASGRLTGTPVPD